MPVPAAVSSAVAPQGLSTQVVIVGGGPVGLGLAIELGQRGIDCLVLERYEQPQPIPKGQNLTQRTMEHFHFWGAEAELRAARTIPASFGIGGLTAYGTLLGAYHYDWLQRALVRPYYFTDNERLPQYATEAVLRARVAHVPKVRTCWGWSVDTLSQSDEGVSVQATHRASGETLAVQADYVVGCDGSRSTVRTHAGMKQTLAEHDRLMVLLVFRSHKLHELLTLRYPGKSYFNVLQPELQGYWKFFGRVDLGSTWFFHAPVPVGTTADNFDFAAYLQQAVGEAFDVEFEHIGFWDLRFALADQYRQGRAFIAGDAAHSHPPYGGYGVNSGFEDARNLGWKLAARLQGWGGDALLDSYDVERRPVFASTRDDFIARSIEVDRDFVRDYHPQRDREAFERAWTARSDGTAAEVNAFEPHYEGSPVLTGNFPATACGGSAKGEHRFEARAGHHLAPAALPSGGNVYERLGPGFTLLALDAPQSAVDAFEAEAKRLRLPLTVVRDACAGECARYGAALVLVRPDQFVAYAGSQAVSAEQACAVLQRAAGLSPLTSGDRT